MSDTTNREPVEAEGSHADAAMRYDDTIRLNWREKLVEIGLALVMVMCGMVIGVIVFIGFLYIMHSTFEELVPELLEEGSFSFIILIILAAVVGNVCSFICAPYLIRLIFRGYELKDERINRSLKRLVNRTGMDIRAERIYRIKGRSANAVVSGLFRKTQYIFFTDKLLERMNEEEIMAVFAHEMAHVKHKHIPRMLLTVVLWICSVRMLSGLIGLDAYFETVRDSWKIWMVSGMNLANVYLLVFLVLFPLSRRHEYQADATAARWVGVSRYKRALHRLYHLNDRLKPPRKLAAKLGTHPTLQERLERVERLEG